LVYISWIYSCLWPKTTISQTPRFQPGRLQRLPNTQIFWQIFSVANPKIVNKANENALNEAKLGRAWTKIKAETKKNLTVQKKRSLTHKSANLDLRSDTKDTKRLPKQWYNKNEKQYMTKFNELLMQYFLHIFYMGHSLCPRSARKWMKMFWVGKNKNKSNKLIKPQLINMHKKRCQKMRRRAK